MTCAIGTTVPPNRDAVPDYRLGLLFLVHGLFLAK
jgi:hypothetical protein